MQVQCGSQARLIRSDILDRDMFDAAPKTPQYTSWTMKLLERLDLAVGPSAFEKQRIFPMPEDNQSPTSDPDSATLQNLAAGEYDALFQGAPDKPSELYHASQIPAPVPQIRLIRSVPLQPEDSVEPTYPPLARVAHIEGMLTFTLVIDSEGDATNLVFGSGHPLLRGAVADAVKTWRFPRDAAGQQVDAAVEFKLNCPRKK